MVEAHIECSVTEDMFGLGENPFAIIRHEDQNHAVLANFLHVSEERSSTTSLLETFRQFFHDLHRAI